MELFSACSRITIYSTIADHVYTKTEDILELIPKQGCFDSFFLSKHLFESSCNFTDTVDLFSAVLSSRKSDHHKCPEE